MILRIKLSSLFIFSIAPVSLFISLFSWNGWNTIRIKRHDTLWYNYNRCAQDATYYRTIGVIIESGNVTSVFSLQLLLSPYKYIIIPKCN